MSEGIEKIETHHDIDGTRNALRFSECCELPLLHVQDHVVSVRHHGLSEQTRFWSPPRYRRDENRAILGKERDGKARILSGMNVDMVMIAAHYHLVVVVIMGGTTMVSMVVVMPAWGALLVNVDVIVVSRNYNFVVMMAPRGPLHVQVNVVVVTGHNNIVVRAMVVVVMVRIGARSASVNVHVLAIACDENLALGIGMMADMDMIIGA